MFEAVDLYCERLGPGLWAEPINAITNAAFLIIAYFVWQLANQRRSISIETWGLIDLFDSPNRDWKWSFPYLRYNLEWSY